MVALIVGFVCVAASGSTFQRRGRATAAVVLGATLVPSLLVAAFAGGRPAVSDLTLGALCGLPVLIAAGWARARFSRRSG
jgi:hypothetical protein